MYPLLFISLTLSILFIQWHSKIVKGRYNITKTYPYIKKFEWFRTILQSNYVLRLCDHYGKTSKQNISKDSLLCDKHLFCAIGQLKSRDRIIIFHYSLSFFWCIVTLIWSTDPTLFMQGMKSYFNSSGIAQNRKVKSRKNAVGYACSRVVHRQLTRCLHWFYCG